MLSVPERTGALPDYTGRGVVMAFIDSGFYPHPDLQGRVIRHVNASTEAITESEKLPPASNFSWHGQMTSVIAAGDGRTSGGRYRGIASDARLVLISVTNPRGQIKEPDILRGMRWLLANHARFGVRILNVSVGGDAPSDDQDHELHRAVRELSEAGITVLVAAGNSGSGHLLPPASAPEAITVGAYDDQNVLDVTRWRIYPNSYGLAHDGSLKPDIVAPGRWIASPILPGSDMALQATTLAALFDLAPNDRRALRRNLARGIFKLRLAPLAALRAHEPVRALLQSRLDSYKLIDSHHQHVDGTSVSVAIASSVVAQMLEANRGLTPARIKAILTTTAKRLPEVPVECQGAGVLDAAEAVRMAKGN